MVRQNFHSPIKKVSSEINLSLIEISPEKLAAIHKLTSPEKKHLYMRLHESGKIIDEKARETIK